MDLTAATAVITAAAALVGIFVGITQLLEYREKQREKKSKSTAILSSPSVPAAAPISSETKAVHTNPPVQRHNLPSTTTGLIGREHELAELRALLARADVRLVTLTGPGGSGKTRLALQLGMNPVDDSLTASGPVFENGVYWVALTNVTDPRLVVPTIAQALELSETTGRPLLDALKTYLQEKQLLLMLDNFEQIMPAAALIGDLLAAAPGLKVVVTSREVLHLNGEHEFSVQSFPLPKLDPLPPLEQLSKFAAIELFVNRAQAVKPDFALTAENARPTAEICTHLDGLPLAIELAAARVKILSPAMILGQLRVNGLNVLSGGARDMPRRQQTLRNTLSWSYDLLNDKDQKLFRRFAVFGGGASLRVVTDFFAGEDFRVEEILDLLASLVDKSLLQQREERDETRFGMLETTREYGLEKLAQAGETQALYNQHLEYFLKLAQEAEPKIKGREQLEWLERLESEHDNLRSALSWSRKGGAVESGLKLAAALAGFWDVRGYSAEGREEIESLLPLCQHLKETPAYAQALAASGGFALAQGDLESARSQIEESVRIFRLLDNSIGLADSLCRLVGTRMSSGDYETAQALLEESLEVSRAAGYESGVARALGWLGFMFADKGDYERARRLLQESLGINRRLGDNIYLPPTFSTLGEIALKEGDYVTARSSYQEALRVARELGLKSSTAVALADLGNLALVQGEYEEASAFLVEGLALSNDLGTQDLIAGTRNLLGRVAIHQNNYDKAQMLFEQNLKWLRQVGHKQGTAWELQSLGHLAMHQGAGLRAGDLLRESLVLFREFGERMGIVDCMEDLAKLASLDGRFTRGVQLMAAADSLRSDMGTPVPPYLREEQANTLATARGHLGDEQYASAWAVGRALTLDEAITLALDQD